MPKLLNNRAAAEYLGYSPATLKDSRNKGNKLAGVEPPKHMVIGVGRGGVRYTEETLDKWVEANRR